MMTKLKRREIIKRLDRLPFKIQIKILDLAEAAAPSPQKGVSGKKLLRFAGILNADEVFISSTVLGELFFGAFKSKRSKTNIK